MLVKITGYTPNLAKGKKILIVVGMEVLAEYGEGEKIGNPGPLDNEGEAAQDQPGNVSANGFYGNKPAPVKQEQTTQSRAMVSRPANNDSIPNLYPIEALSPYAHRWTIRARVTHKAPMKTWHNQQGEGRLFSFNLLDETSEIRATVFHSIGELKTDVRACLTDRDRVFPHLDLDHLGEAMEVGWKDGLSLGIFEVDQACLSSTVSS